jgi:hypothetical protein
VMVIEDSVSLLLPDAVEFGDKKESAAPSNAQWTNEDKSKRYTPFTTFNYSVCFFRHVFKSFGSLRNKLQTNRFVHALQGDLQSRFILSFDFIDTSISQSMTNVTNYYKTNLTALNLAEIAAKASRRSPSPDLRDLHWKEMTFPASEPILSSSSRPSSSASLIQPPPISAAGYDLAKNVYPASSTLPYHNQSSEDIPSSSWSGRPLPTRISQPQTHIVPPNPPSVIRPEDTCPPSQSPHHAGYSSLTSSRNTSLPYRYIPRPGVPAEQHAHSPPPPGKYHDGPHPPPLPTRQSHERSGISSSPTWSPEEHREHPRSRISVSTSSASARSHSPPPHSSIMSGSSVSGYVPGLPSGATPIIHSPTIPSPKLPLHRATTPYEPHPLPPPSQGDDPRTRIDARGSTSRNPPAAPRSPVIYQTLPHSHSRQRSGSSATGWGHPMSAFPQQHNRYYNTSELPHSNNVSRTMGVGDSSVSNETRREIPYDAATAVRSNSNASFTHANHSRRLSADTPSAVWSWVPQGAWID